MSLVEADETGVRPSNDRRWFAIAFAAVDVAGSQVVAQEADLLVLPALPADPLALVAHGASVWRRLVGSALESELSDEERSIVAEMATMGLASTDEHHAARVRRIEPAWFSSPLHELVCALLHNVARSIGTRLVIIKGPMLHRQGLRAKEHSGDVDIWVEAGTEALIADELEKWGWTRAPMEFAPSMYHSLTMRPHTWGCEIDIHYRFPGTDGEPGEIFNTLVAHSTVASFASFPVDVPDVRAHAVLHSLHLLRPNPLAEVGRDAREQSLTALRLAGEEVIQVVAEFGSLPILRDLLFEAFPGRAVPASPGAIPLDWQMRNAQTVASYHRRSIRGLPVRERPKAIWRAVWPSEEAARLSVERRGGTAASALSARAKRILYGLRDVLRLRRC